MTVTYAAVAGYPDYRVGDDGSVWSRRPLGRSNIPTNWRPLRQTKRRNGYCLVSLCRGGKPHPHYVHRLVLFAFAGAGASDDECRHLDGNAVNNRLSNLAWGSKATNAGDKVTHKTAPIGERNPSARLTEDAVRSIRARLALGESAGMIAISLGVSRGAIKEIRDGRNWRHVGAALAGVVG